MMYFSNGLPMPSGLAPGAASATGDPHDTNYEANSEEDEQLLSLLDADKPEFNPWERTWGEGHEQELNQGEDADVTISGFQFMCDSSTEQVAIDPGGAKMKVHRNVASCCQPPWMQGCLAGWSHGRGSGGKRYAYECQLCNKRWAQIRPQYLKEGEDPQIKFDVRRGDKRNPKRGPYRCRGKNGCGLLKNEKEAAIRGEDHCKCPSKKKGSEDTGEEDASNDASWDLTPLTADGRAEAVAEETAAVAEGTATAAVAEETTAVEVSITAPASPALEDILNYTSVDVALMSELNAKILFVKLIDAAKPHKNILLSTAPAGHNTAAAQIAPAMAPASALAEADLGSAPVVPPALTTAAPAPVSGSAPAPASAPLAAAEHSSTDKSHSRAKRKVMMSTPGVGSSQLFNQPQNYESGEEAAAGDSSRNSSDDDDNDEDDVGDVTPPAWKPIRAPEKPATTTKKLKVTTT
eukprot:6155519-Prymnesium_polylepis.1